MKVQVISPWYPDRYSPYSGIFVKKQVDALKGLGHEVAVEVPVIYPAPQGDVPEGVYEAMRVLAEMDTSAVFEDDGEAVRVPAPVPSRSGDLGRSRAYARSLALKRSLFPVEADVTHAHLGIPTGLAATSLLDRPLVVTEHQSTLSRVFGQPGGIAAYESVVEASSAFICVSEHLRSQIADVIDETLADSIEIVPNIVDLSGIPFKDHRPGPLDHWLYVGTIASHKGVELLVKAFKAYRGKRRSAVLTIVGDGPHRPWVERFAAGSGMSKALRLVGAVPHAEIGTYLAEADILVHLSSSETFGISTLEAIGAGLPVVSLRNGGAESAWGDFETVVGRLLPTDAEPERVAAAVTGLAEDPAALDPALGRHLVEQRFSPTEVAKSLTAVYERVV